MCANTIALNKYLEKQEQQEKAFENLERDIEDQLLELSEMIETTKDIAKGYQGYDFSQDVEDLIKELI